MPAERRSDDRSSDDPSSDDRSGDVPLGLRRVEFIRLIVGDGPTRAEAVGVGYRLPVTVPVPVSTALRLARRGVPFVLCRPATPSPGAAAQA